MKNDDEMYQSVLSRRENYHKKKEKRIRTIRRTVPVLACFCFTIVFGLKFWDNLANLHHFPIQPDIVDEPMIENSESTTAADTTEISSIAQGNKNDSATTAASPDHTENGGTPATDTAQTITTVVAVDNGDYDNGQESIDNGETDTPSVSTPVGDTDPITPPQTTVPIIQIQPITEIQTISPIQTTAEAPKTTAAVSEPITIATTKPPEIVQEPIDPPAQEPIDPPVYDPVAPPAQPISFDNIETAAYAIRNNDVSSYPEQAQDVYLKMFERIRNDNFLYQASCSELISLKEDFGICLFPYAAYEDMGIGHYVTYKGKIYHVTFYYTDPYVISETDSIGDYLQKRMGRRSDKEIIIQNQKFSESITGDGRIYASSFIDADHYYDIVTSAPEDELMKFLSIFSYEKIPL